MIRRITVADVMSTALITTTADAGLAEAADLLVRHGISGLPVLDAAGGLVGIVTEQDCLRVACRRDYYQGGARTVGEAMTRDVVSIDADADIMTAIDAFLRHSFRRLPVLRAGRLVGLVSRTDALRVMRRFV